MPKDGPMQVIPFRLPDSLVKRLEQHAERLQREQPGLRITRADALRLLVLEALERAEGAAKKGAKRGKA